MPIFEYECRDCGAKFEKIVNTSNGNTIVCKNCQSRRVSKLLSVFAVAGGASKELSAEPGPCACGAPRRGMCGE